MHHTVYFNKKALHLFNAADAAAPLFAKANGLTLLQAEKDESLSGVIKRMQSDDGGSLVLVHEDLKKLMALLKHGMTVICAGGGLVYTPENKVLLIFRRGKWDLPKGKKDEGENIAATALREVAEETGLPAPRLGAHLLTTYHTYVEKKEMILKESYWYLMESNEAENLQPQAEEDIEKCEWVRFADLAPYLANTHPSVIDVLAAGAAALGIEAKNTPNRVGG